MWCSNCRQDVPALGSALEAGLFCARCQSALAADRCVGSAAGQHAEENDHHQRDLPVDTLGAARSDISAPSHTRAESVWNDLDSSLNSAWDSIDEMLSRADLLLGKAAEIPRREAATFSQLDGPHLGPSGWHHQPPRPLRLYRPPSRASIVSWCSLGAALAGFVCGSVLLGWSLIGGRPELWNIGETITLASQVGLLIGLVLQLDRIGQDRRQTAARLTRLDQQVETLHTTVMPGTPGPPPPNFASPASRPVSADEALLADLQSQLDRLASTLRDKRTA
jgi:hypothetical protein